MLVLVAVLGLWATVVVLRVLSVVRTGSLVVVAVVP